MLNMFNNKGLDGIIIKTENGIDWQRLWISMWFKLGALPQAASRGLCKI